MAKERYRYVSHTDAYTACIGLLENSPHPGLFGIYVNQSILYLFSGIFIFYFFTDGYTSIVLGYLITPVFLLMLYPTYSKYLRSAWLFLNDLLISEYRSSKLKKAYLRNFYD